MNSRFQSAESPPGGGRGFATSVAALRRWALLSVLLLAGGFASAAVLDINVDSMFSFDPLGYPDNCVLTIDLGELLGTPAPVVVDGLGWDVWIYPEAGSWFSEAHIAFQDTDQNLLYDFAPGYDHTWNDGHYVSDGIIDLGSDGHGFTLSDGVLRLEFYESYNDFSPQPEAIWYGVLQIRAGAVPLPPSGFLLAGTLALCSLAWLRQRAI